MCCNHTLIRFSAQVLRDAGSVALVATGVEAPRDRVENATMRSNGSPAGHAVRRGDVAAIACTSYPPNQLELGKREQRLTPVGP